MIGDTRSSIYGPGHDLIVGSTCSTPGMEGLREPDDSSINTLVCLLRYTIHDQSLYLRDSTLYVFRFPSR